MCLWYNMTKHQRLKLVILGRLLALLEDKYFHWPMPVTDSNCTDSSSPSDSNSSSSSVSDYFYDRNCIDYYNITPIAMLVDKKTGDSVTSPYRKYIENILKVRGLGKSLNFLERLHQHVLWKAKATLDKPQEENFFQKVCVLWEKFEEQTTTDFLHV